MGATGSPRVQSAISQRSIVDGVRGRVKQGIHKKKKKPEGFKISGDAARSPNRTLYINKKKGDGPFVGAGAPQLIKRRGNTPYPTASLRAEELRATKCVEYRIGWEAAL